MSNDVAPTELGAGCCCVACWMLTYYILMRRGGLLLTVTTALLAGCTTRSAMESALNQAGSNRTELEAVLNHYRDTDINPQKLRAAEFLIENMPAHYSYADERIHEYYDYAVRILADKSLTPNQQRDSLQAITARKYSDLSSHTVPDAQVIKADFLIDNIDKTYAQWTTCPWTGHLTFDEYLEWILPYKLVELQEMDNWRDTMYAYYGATCLEHRSHLKNDVEYNNAVHVADTVRYLANKRIRRNVFNTGAGLPLLSDHLLANLSFGTSSDYSLMAALLIRSLGVPVVLDETPVGPRGNASTRWLVVLSDRGDQLMSEWDFKTKIGEGFFPYERGPKVFRSTYSINRDREEYLSKAKYKYPFKLNVQDVTHRYFLVSDLRIPVDNAAKRKLKDKYVYIASAVRDESNPWQIVDFGKIKGGKACFNDMGREVLYTIMGYDGTGLIEITDPFILHKDGSVEYISAETISSASIDKWKNCAL